MAGGTDNAFNRSTVEPPAAAYFHVPSSCSTTALPSRVITVVMRHLQAGYYTCIP